MRAYRGKLRDGEGRTGYRFMRELFEYTNCEECGKGVRAHTAVPIGGNWFARCTPVPPPCIQAMRCYCVGHANGLDVSEPCDTNEENYR